MRTSFLLLGAVFTLGLVVGPATAGSQKGVASPYPVVIDLPNKHAKGSLGSARNSSDSVQYIYVDVGVTTGFDMVATTICFKNSAGTKHCCTSYDDSEPEVSRAAAATAGDMYLDVTWDANDRCSTIIIEHGSDSTPKLL